MNGPEQFAEAERLLTEAAAHAVTSDARRALLAEAQVRATLAHAAATVDSAPSAHALKAWGREVEPYYRGTVEETLDVHLPVVPREAVMGHFEVPKIPEDGFEQVALPHVPLVQGGVFADSNGAYVVRAMCSCGWRGTTYSEPDSSEKAEADALAHVAESIPMPPVTIDYAPLDPKLHRHLSTRSAYPVAGSDEKQTRCNSTCSCGWLSPNFFKSKSAARSEWAESHMHDPSLFITENGANE